LHSKGCTEDEAEKEMEEKRKEIQRNTNKMKEE
jgi:hypothetical protein